jgi:hypothetical protein
MVQEKDEELLQTEDILEKCGIVCTTDTDYMQLPIQSQFNKRAL